MLSPLVSALGILLFGISRRRLSALLANGGLLLSFACALSLFVQARSGGLTLPLELSVTWIGLPDFSIPFGVLIDRLSLLMSLVVTGVGSAIFLYSIGYMADDAGYSRYFGLLSLFAFSMLAIVLATNWIELFIGWELVGFCSYALIGHWYEKPAAAEAGKKAFMVNRVADFGFLLGIVWLWAVSSPIAAERSVQFQTLYQRLPHLMELGWLSPTALTGIGLLLFCGVLGKSAQFPLHVWLPDAMEGPTSVSALIHAATMVAAGVYMLCRTFWLFEELRTVLTVIAWVGGATAFLSACLAIVESDLKRILAYSTLSQLGYMVMAVGLGGAGAGMYHLTTHAFFKALLFLSAGSVIHGTHRQNIWELGGLWTSMRWTSLSFFVGALALCGAPGLSGFFSKDAILALAHEHNASLYWLGTVTAGFTAFYTARVWCVAFVGKAVSPAADGTSSPAGMVPARSPAHGLHPHESPTIMLVPLAVLAALSIVGGYLGIPAFLGEQAAELHWGIAGTSLVVVAIGVGLAWLIYGTRSISPSKIAQTFGPVYRLLLRHYRIDDAYAWYVDRIQQRLIASACALFERFVIIGLAVNGTAWTTKTAGRLLRLCQTGKVQQYVLVFFVGVVALLYLANHP